MRLAEGKITVDEHEKILTALSAEPPPDAKSDSPKKLEVGKPPTGAIVYGLWAIGLIGVVLGLMGLYGAWMLRNFCIGSNCRPDPNYLTPAIIGAIGAYLIYLAENKRRTRA
jgi:hypothetical protein